MKASTVIALAAGLTASVVSAQSITDLPQCALGCAIPALGATGCSTTDVKCICEAQQFIGQLTPCVADACTPAEVAKTLEVAAALCQSVGVSLTVPSQIATSAPISSATSSLASSASESSASVSSAASSIISEVSSIIGNATSTGGSGPVPTNGTTPTPSDDLPAPSGTDPSSAGRNTVVFGGLGAAVIAFAATFL